MTSAPTLAAKPPFWRNLRILRLVIQVAAVALTGLLLYVLWFNLTNNLRAQGIRTDFGFLNQPVGVNIAGSNITPGSTILQALIVGVKNTFALVIVGLPLLTILGVIVGIARLSTNFLAARTATLYVEVFRNLPPLLLIIFFFRAVILPLPPPRAPFYLPGWLVVSNLSITVPGFTAGDQAQMFAMVMAGALVAALAVAIWRTRLSDRTGVPHRRILWFLGLLTGVAVLAYLALDRPITLSPPILDGRTIEGGFSGFGSYFAVMGALVLYTASHVAEIVRGSIQAVSRGQGEAANALALTSFQRLRYVILPQAFRIAIPPTINQYLNYTKNTSLALVIGFAEVATIAGQAIGNGQPAPQVILMLMAAYLVFSLVISSLANVLNRRLQLVTR